MNQGKYIFAQLTEFLPRRVFDGIVDKYEANKRVRSFTCWNQMLCMVFGQLTAWDSMRDLMLSLEAHQSKYYHPGFGSTVSHRNHGTANERRNCKIFEEFAYVLIAEARRSCYRDDFEIDVDGNVYALDSTTIDLCLNIFWWSDMDLVFLTNNMDLSASEIALLYKKRWAVELFFKWMKQHLKIKSF